MIKSKFFWAGAILLAIIPLFALDIPKHYVDWTRDVHDEMIDVAQNSYNYTRQQKAHILDDILAGNKHLMAMMYIKSFASILLLAFSIYFFVRYREQHHNGFWKPIAFVMLVLACTVSIKIYSWYSFNGNENIKLLSLTNTDSSLNNIYDKNFKGKVVYVDFWGTTCGPCLEEFRNFTKPLKAKFHNRKDIAYLYICGGREMVWRQQLQKFDVAGSHIFLNAKEYDALYRKSTQINKDLLVYMPRYLIINKQGKIVATSAPRPSDADSISTLLDKYLAVN